MSVSHLCSKNCGHNPLVLKSSIPDGRSRESEYKPKMLYGDCGTRANSCIASTLPRSPWNADSASCAAARGEAFRQTAEQRTVGRLSGSLKRLLHLLAPCRQHPQLLLWLATLQAETRNTATLLHTSRLPGCWGASKVRWQCMLGANLRLVSPMHVDSHESRGIRLPTWHCLVSRRRTRS